MRMGIVCVSAGILVGLMACGGTPDSTFGDPPAAEVKSSVPPGASFGEMGPAGTNAACVSEIASAELTPTNLIFIYDKSASMGAAQYGFDPAKKWIPVGIGMKEFFGDAYSKTLRASLQFFPMNDVTIQTACDYSYATPSVSLSLASDPAFTQAIDGSEPSGGTPTLPALEGAIAYAKEIAASHPGDKTAVVLVSDGEPGFFNQEQQAFVPGCADNDVAHVAAAAKAAFETAPSVPTYVIGVGPSLSALNQIASAGGTTSAVMVDVNDPTQTKTQVVSALSAIRKSEISCDFSIPPAPAGKEVDPFSVNVILKQTGGTETVLGYSKDCASKAGWRYDNVASPKRILLCADACSEARSPSLDKVAIAFGCKTRTEVQ